MAAPRTLSTALVLALVALVSWAAREAADLRFAYPPDSERAGEWFLVDADGLYHLRRIERVFEEGLPPAGRDPLLAGGAAIPWPPYYTLAAWGLLAPFAPEAEAARRPWLERRAGTLPMLFGVLASLLAALAGLRLAGAPGGLAAGALHALCYGSIHYSVPGIADHHAWISLLNLALLLVLMRALEDGLASPRRAAALGTLAGALAGLALGSWVASLLYVVSVQVLLGVLLLVHGRRELPGLPALGLSFHLAILVVVLPAVLLSPWTDELPWIVVDLSWFHLAQPALGALVFLPLVLGPPTPRRRRLHPWFAAGGLLALTALLAATDAAPWRGLREGLEWVSRADEFMSAVAESEPLLGADRTGTGGVFRWLGFGVLLAPVAWIAGVRAARAGRLELAPWLVAVPLLVAQALLQRRFADAAAGPLAVLLAWGLVAAVQRARRAEAPFGPLLGAAVLALVALSQLPTVRVLLERRGRDPVDPTQIGWRALHEWLRERTPPEGAVLANWDQGHALEWVAGRESVATNFGSYVGAESFRAPARFFLARDAELGDELLARHGVRHVLVTSNLLYALPDLMRAAAPERPEELMTTGLDEGGRPRSTLQSGWLETMAHLLSGIGDGDGPEGPRPPLRNLRLVHVSPYPDFDPNLSNGGAVPCGRIWERVPGALLELRTAPGATLEVELELAFATEPGLEPHFTMPYRDRAVADDEGLVRLRLPYTTDDGEGGDAGVLSARWRSGELGGELRVPAAAVLEGLTVELR